MVNILGISDERRTELSILFKDILESSNTTDDIVRGIISCEDMLFEEKVIVAYAAGVSLSNDGRLGGQVYDGAMYG